MALHLAQGRKRGHGEEEARGSISRGTTIELESRLRIGCAIAKTEEEVALELMAQLKRRGHPQRPPALATDGKGNYREAMLSTWGQVPQYTRRGRPPMRKQPGSDWHSLQIVKERSGSRLIAVYTTMVYEDPLLGEHTAYVERRHLTSRQMNGRLVRKSLSYSKQLKLLRTACSWEDWVYNLTREVEDTAGGVCLWLWAATRACTDFNHGRRTDESYLDGEGAIDDRRSSYHYQHKIGRLPE